MRVSLALSSTRCLVYGVVCCHPDSFATSATLATTAESAAPISTPKGWQEGEDEAT